MSELKNKLIFQLLLAASQMMLPLITYPYISRVLGPASLGVVNYVDFTAQFFTIIACFGIPFYAVRETAFCRNDPVRLSKLVRELAGLQLFFVALAGIAYILFCYHNWHQHPVLYLLGLVSMLLNTVSFEWYMQGTEQFRLAASRTLLIRLLMLVAFFVLVQSPADAGWYFGIYTAGSALIAGVNLVQISRQLQSTREKLQPTKHLGHLTHFFITGSAIGLYVYFDTILLGKISGDATAVGVYSTALKIAKIGVVAVMALGTVMAPRIAFLSGQQQEAQIAAHHQKFLSVLSVAGLPLCSLLFVLAPEIISLMAGDAFKAAVPLLQLLCFLPLIIGLSNLYCFQTLIPLKQEKKIVPAVIAGCCCSIALNYGLIPLYGAIGAAVATVITEAVVTLLTGWFAHRVVRLYLPANILFQTITATGMMILAIIALRMLHCSSWMVVLAGAGGGLMVYSGIQLLIFRNPLMIESQQYLQQLWQRLNRT